MRATTRCLTQKDVRELQLSKGPFAAVIRTLMDEMVSKLETLAGYTLAGALGNYVNPYSAIRTGLIPMVSQSIITLLGNAATTGALMVLLSKEYWQTANELIQFIEHVELSSRLDFNNYIIQDIDIQ